MLVLSLELSFIQAETITFDKDKIDVVSKGWTAGVTGSGNFKWVVSTDPEAVSKPVER